MRPSEVATEGGARTSFRRADSEMFIRMLSGSDSSASGGCGVRKREERNRRVRCVSQCL